MRHAASAADSIAIVESSASGERWVQLANLSFGGDFPAAATIDIDRGAMGQTVAGFGGALTESAAWNFAQLSPAARQQFLNAYWGSTGLGYVFGRVPMNSADFALSSYSEDNATADYALADFDTALTRDHTLMIPLIQAVRAASARSLQLYISPWSPPAWMKTNNNMIGSFDPCLLADPRVHAAWAAYFVRFIQSYADAGVPLWGLTAQNEPLTDAGMRYEVGLQALLWGGGGGGGRRVHVDACTAVVGRFVLAPPSARYCRAASSTAPSSGTSSEITLARPCVPPSPTSGSWCVRPALQPRQWCRGSTQLLPASPRAGVRPQQGRHAQLRGAHPG